VKSHALWLAATSKGTESHTLWFAALNELRLSDVAKKENFV